MKLPALIASLASIGLSNVLLASSARGEVEIGTYTGLHVFSSHDALGRRGFSPPNSLDPSAILGARLGYLQTPRFGGELEVGAVPASGHDGTQLSVAQVRVHALANILTGRYRPFVMVGVGALVTSPLESAVYKNDVQIAPDLGCGVHADIGDWWGARADVRLLMDRAAGGATVALGSEYTVGIYGRFPAPPPPEERGRSPLIDDTDHDGVGDALDKCKEVPGPVRNYGCPIDGDRDHDGVLDKDDRCPDVAGTAAFKGCKDTDGDSLPDPDDACPNEAGVAENKGCPDRDSDGDGIVDRKDACPRVAETVNGFEDTDGCPDTAPPPPKPPPPPMTSLERLDFERGSSKPTNESLSTLDIAAAMLRERPTTRVEITGHTDLTGNAAVNLKLSQERADVVKAYLVEKGVSPSQIEAVGKGASEPLSKGTDALSNRRNRRVEFKVIPPR